jgi:hypothetical protein
VVDLAGSASNSRRHHSIQISTTGLQSARHPATLQVMHELGFVDEFRSLLQNEITPLDVVIGKRRFTPDRSLHPAGRAVLSGGRFERVVVEHQDL